MPDDIDDGSAFGRDRIGLIVACGKSDSSSNPPLLCREKDRLAHAIARSMDIRTRLFESRRHLGERRKAVDLGRKLCDGCPGPWSGTPIPIGRLVLIRARSAQSRLAAIYGI